MSRQRKAFTLVGIWNLHRDLKGSLKSCSISAPTTRTWPKNNSDHGRNQHVGYGGLAHRRPLVNFIMGMPSLPHLKSFTNEILMKSRHSANPIYTQYELLPSDCTYIIQLSGSSHKSMFSYTKVLWFIHGSRLWGWLTDGGASDVGDSGCDIFTTQCT